MKKTRIEPNLNNVSAFVSIICVACCNQAWAQDPPPVRPAVQETRLPPEVKIAVPLLTDPSLIRPLSASEAAKIALARQAQVAAALHNARAANARVREAQAALYPSLSSGLDYSQTTQLGSNSNVNANGLSNSSGSGSSSSGYTGNLAVTQLLFDFNITRDSVRQAQALARSQGFVLTQAQSDLVLATKQAFYTLVQNIKLVDVAQSSLKNTQGQLDLARARVQSGLGAPQDVILAQTGLDSAILQLTNARAASLSARITLAQTMGVDPSTPITLSESVETTSSEALPKLLTDSLLHRAEISAAKANLDAANLGVSLARKTTSPSFSLSWRANGQGTANLSDNRSTTAGVSMSWGIFDGGFASAKKSEARESEISSRKQLEYVTQQVQADVATVYVALQIAQDHIPIAVSQAANAQESVRLAEGRYRAGLATFLEVLTAQTSLTQANVNLTNADSALQIARAGLNHAIGASVD